jgi:site-specific recombinase XerD
MMHNNITGLLDLVTIELNRQQLKERTRAAYFMWINRFIKYAGGRLLIDDQLVCRFIAQLDASDKSVATRKSCLSALRFFYKHILKLPCIYNGSRLIDEKPRHIELITITEIKQLMAPQSNDLNMVVLLIYGAGLRMAEVVNLRVGNIHFKKRLISAESEFTDRRHVLFPNALVNRLKSKVFKATEDFQADLQAGIKPATNGRKALDHKHAWLFPGRSLIPAENDHKIRCHASADKFQKALRQSSLDILNRKITANILRNSFAYSLFVQGCSKEKIKAAMGYENPNTIARLLKAFKQIKKECAPLSPLDFHERIKHEQ